ncbi:hypothetical protein [uncultured Corynebacterium sp.]|uniref:hypothetical protein n=1 Tax=uncultured Corynebacterium sp. TaxID=159447 RepID=UPI0025D742DD|nr:hypothetical protein [uncultured Corynebacterium sp.]
MRHPRTAALLTGGALLLTTSACADEAVFNSSVSDETDPAAAGVSVPADASVFRSSAIGPERRNHMLKDGDPLSFVDPGLLDADGELPAGMTVTEAQSLQVLSQVENLLSDRKLKLFEVATVRVYLAPTGRDGRDGADFDGWERAYRRYFANIDRDTGRSLVSDAEEPVETTAVTTPAAPTTEPEPDSAADSAPESAPASAPASASASASVLSSRVDELYPGTDNRTRPTLVTVAVSQQPVAGWLVQVEIEAVHGEK